MRRLPLLALLVASVLWPLATPVRAQASNQVEVVKVEGIIDRTVEGFLLSRLEDVPDGGALLLQIDSPGTLGVDAVALARRFAEAPVPVVAWAGPPGALVQGGAVLLFEAAAIAATSGGSGIGPARPIDLGRRPDAETGDAVGRAAAAAAGFAEARDRDGEAARRLVEDAATILAPQAALDAGVADLAAASAPTLLAEIDGQLVETALGPVELVTQGDPGSFTLRFSDLGPVARVLHAVASPTASYVLLVLALWAVAFEVTQPGFGLAGVAAVVLGGLAIYSLTVAPAGALGLALLLSGVAALTLDVRLRRLGLLTLLGVGAFAAGSLLVFRRVAASVDPSVWLIGFAVVGTALYFGFALTVATKAREEAITARQTGLVGLVGEAASDLDPEGHVLVKGAMWQARAVAAPIAGGARVRVRGVDGLVLQVTEESRPDQG